MAQQKQEIQVPNYLKFSKVISWFMYFWVMIGVISLGFRVFLLLFSANTGAGFYNFVMNVSNDYMNPFRGLFNLREVGETGYLDISALFAIIIYLLLAWGFKSLIEYVETKIEMNKREQKMQLLNKELKQSLSGKRRTSTK